MPPVHSSGAGAPEGWCGPLGAGERLVCRSREEPPRRPECQVRRQGSSALGHGPAPSPTPGPPWSTAGAMRPPLLGSQDQGLVGHPVPGRYSWTPCAFPHHLSAQHPQKHKAGPSLGWDAHSPPTSLQGRSRGHAGWGGSSEAGATPTLCSPAPGLDGQVTLSFVSLSVFLVLGGCAQGYRVHQSLPLLPAPPLPQPRSLLPSMDMRRLREPSPPVTPHGGRGGGQAVPFLGGDTSLDQVVSVSPAPRSACTPTPAVP